MYYHKEMNVVKREKWVKVNLPHLLGRAPIKTI